jgi:hypothetical protein
MTGERYAPYNSLANFNAAGQRLLDFRPRQNPDNLGCIPGNADSVPSSLALNDGTIVSPDELLARLQDGKFSYASDMATQLMRNSDMLGQV